jgi:hypothetical protein
LNYENRKDAFISEKNSTPDGGFILLSLIPLSREFESKRVRPPSMEASARYAEQVPETPL